MIRWRRLIEIGSSKRKHLWHATLMLCAVRAGLWILPFRTLQLMAARRVPHQGLAHAPDAQDITWAVTTAARYIPGATCLPQALTAQWLLARAGYRSELKLGIAKGDRRAIDAHAWLEIDGRMVIGGDEASRFTPMR